MVEELEDKYMEDRKKLLISSTCLVIAIIYAISGSWPLAFAHLALATFELC